MHIVPAILPKDFSEIVAKLERVRGIVSAVQIDVADGRFALSKTWPYTTLSSGKLYDADFQDLIQEKRGLPFWEDFDFEFDLMVKDPEEVVPDYVHLGASRLIFHIESIQPDALSDLIREWKHAVDIGLALKPSTPISLLTTFLHEVNFVQCMGNDRIGFQGVGLDRAKVLPKISSLRANYPDLTISVDIGVSIETAPKLIEAGANRLVAGSAIFGSANPMEAVRRFESFFL